MRCYFKKCLFLLKINYKSWLIINILNLNALMSHRNHSCFRIIKIRLSYQMQCRLYVTITDAVYTVCCHTRSLLPEQYWANIICLDDIFDIIGTIDPYSSQSSWWLHFTYITLILAGMISPFHCQYFQSKLTFYSFYLFHWRFIAKITNIKPIFNQYWYCIGNTSD